MNVFKRIYITVWDILSPPHLRRLGEVLSRELDEIYGGVLPRSRDFNGSGLTWVESESEEGRRLEQRVAERAPIYLKRNNFLREDFSATEWREMEIYVRDKCLHCVFGAH